MLTSLPSPTLSRPRLLPASPGPATRPIRDSKVKSSLRSGEPNFIQMPIIIDGLWSVERNIPQISARFLIMKMKMS